MYERVRWKLNEGEREKRQNNSRLCIRVRKNAREGKGEGESRSVSARSNKRVNESNERLKRIDFSPGLSHDHHFFFFFEELNDFVQASAVSMREIYTRLSALGESPVFTVDILMMINTFVSFLFKGFFSRSFLK